MVEGTFLEVAEGDEHNIAIPAPGGGTRLASAAWVSRDDNTTARVPYESIRPV
jgi:hypothetical protein